MGNKVRIKLIHIIIPALIVAIGHFTALLLGLYQGKVWVDIPLHFIFGVLLGLLWFWVLQKQEKEISGFLTLVTAASFALFGSFVWELFEFSFWKLLPDYAAILKIYSSTVSDVLSDLLAGLTGGIVVAIINRLKHSNILKNVGML